MVRGIQVNTSTGDLVDMAMEHLDMVIRIWSDYRMGSVERSMTERAEMIRNKLISEFVDNLDSTKELRNVA